MNPKHIACRVIPAAAKFGIRYVHYGIRHNGQSLVEWTLLLALISITCAASLGPLGQGVNASLSTVNSNLSGNIGEGSMGQEGPTATPAPNPNPNQSPSETPMEQNIGAPLNYPS